MDTAVEPQGVGEKSTVSLSRQIALAVQRHADGVSRAILFGSVARGDEGPESDVDLLLVWPDSTDEDTRWDRSMRIARIVDAVVGKVCIPLIYTDREYEGISPALSTSLQRDGVDLLSSST